MTFIVIDEDEFRRELEETTKDYRAGKAEEALAVAKSMAADISSSGDYEGSLEVGGDDGSILGTTDEAGHIIEWGSVDTEAHGILRAAAEAVGAEVEDEGAG